MSYYNKEQLSDNKKHQLKKQNQAFIQDNIQLPSFMETTQGSCINEGGEKDIDIEDSEYLESDRDSLNQPKNATI